MAQPLVVGQDTHFVTPYLIGDAAFPLQMHMMKLYAGDNLGEKELAFNRIFVRARRHIEQAFGRLIARWQVLKASRPGFAVEFMREVVILCCALHNICQKERQMVSEWLPEEAPAETQERGRVVKEFEDRKGAKRARRDEVPCFVDERAMRDMLAEACLEREGGGFR